MKITVFENPSDGHVLDQGPTWHIITKCQTILFVSGNSDNFWKEAQNRGICVADIDMVFLPKGCQDPIRELEMFLLHNHKAVIYLSRKANEDYLNALYSRFRGYKDMAKLHRWRKRVVFMDDCVKINDEVRIFTRSSPNKNGTVQKQNMILSEDGIQTLFVNNEHGKKETVQKEAEEISGTNMNYMFYQNHNHKDMIKDCITEELNEILRGQEVVIGKDEL